MKQIELQDMPRNYAFCSHEECSRRKTCLHWLAYKEYPVMMQNVFYNLRWIEEQGGANNCPNYADSAPVSYAIGFKHIFDELPKKKGIELREKLIAKFGQYNFYRYRRGQFIMPPSVQQTIILTLKEIGITKPNIFDYTERRVHWGEHKVKK